MFFEKKKKMQQTTLVADQISSSTLKQKLQQEKPTNSQSVKRHALRIFHIINKNFRHRAIEKNDVLGQELCWVFFFVHNISLVLD